MQAQSGDGMAETMDFIEIRTELEHWVREFESRANAQEQTEGETTALLEDLRPLIEDAREWVPDLDAELDHEQRDQLEDLLRRLRIGFKRFDRDQSPGGPPLD
jgi:hypothetical protein